MFSLLDKVGEKTQLRSSFLSFLPLGPDTEQHLAGALSETLQHPGSMVRAELAYRVARSYGFPVDGSERLAISVEYFHTASLLFDDLPCMDNAAHRRGAPCVHNLFGEGAAILAALALINRAYALMWKTFSSIPIETQQAALGYVERNLGIAGLLNGQSRDLYYSRSPQDSRASQQIALEKTVPLIRLSLVLPAIVGGAPSEELHALERLAAFWGLSYQTLDDLKDVLHLADEGGKTVARDAALNRPNMALTIGITNSFRRVERLMDIGDRIISQLTRRQPPLSFLNETRERFKKEIITLSKAGSAQAV
jgi:geranylgeranyl pyrophosphate synthase